MRQYSTAIESGKQDTRAANTVRVALERTRTLIGFIAILGAAISGYASLNPLLVAASAIALAALSQAEYGGLYRRAAELGHGSIGFSVAMRSFANALLASGGAYLGGALIRLL
jgi:hypothetical protein